MVGWKVVADREAMDNGVCMASGWYEADHSLEKMDGRVDEWIDSAHCTIVSLQC